MKRNNLIKYNCNTCDQIANEVMVHYTKSCENKCPFCIDALNAGVSCAKPDKQAVLFRIIQIIDNVDSITFTGGEPLLYMEDLIDIIKEVKEIKPSVKIGAITSIPSICDKKKELFYTLFEQLDILIISVQHYDESIADKIRGVKSKFNHQDFYKELIEHCTTNDCIDKLSININVCKPYLFTKSDVLKSIEHYNKLGFKNIRICEMFERDDMFVNIEECLNIKLGQPFSTGCSTVYDIRNMIPSFDGKLTIKRDCFYKTKHRHANIFDLIKIMTRWIVSKKYFFGVIHENGKIYRYWV